MQTFYFSNTGCSAKDEDFIRLTKILGVERTNNLFEADCIVQHFCGMSSECFEDIPKFMFILKKIKEDKPDIKIFVGGCASEIVDLQKRYPFVDGVFSRRHMVEDISKYLGFDPNTDKEKPISNHNSVRIQSGCLRHCGFCKKHFMDMPLKSKKIEQVLRDIDDVVKHSYSYIILHAENSTEYGIDLGCRLIDLLKEIEKNPRIKNIYLSALCIDELVLNPELVEYIQNSKKITTVQVEIQSLIPEVRQNMNLSSSKEDVLEILRRFSKKRIITNIMLGYPGENQKDFNEQLRVIREENLYYVQINAYDNTPGTPSYAMPQIKKKDVENRMLQMVDLLTELRMAKAKSIMNNSKLFGCTGVAVGKKTLHLNGESISVTVDTDKEFCIGDTVRVKITGIDEMFSGINQTLCLKGEII